MSDILTKHIYNCNCHPFCNEKSYFKTRCDNAGFTLITQGAHIDIHGHSKEEIEIGLFNSQEITALITILTDR